MKVNVKIKRLSEDVKTPEYAHEFDAGFDLVATEDVIIGPMETKLIPVGLAFEIPPHYEMQIRPRSGITSKSKLRVQLGTIDSTYRGEVHVIVDNAAVPTITDVNFKGIQLDMTLYPRGIDDKFIEEESLLGSYVDRTYLIRKGDRIGQAVINKVEQAKFEVKAELSETSRGDRGFGSTGVSSK